MAMVTKRRLYAQSALVEVIAEGGSRKPFLILPQIRVIDGAAYISVREETGDEAHNQSRYVLVIEEGEEFNPSPGTPGFRSFSDYDVYLGNFEQDGAVYHVFAPTPDKNGC